MTRGTSFLRAVTLSLLMVGSLEGSVVCSSDLYSWVTGSPLVHQLDPFDGTVLHSFTLVVDGVPAPVHALAGGHDGGLFYALAEVGGSAQSSLVLVYSIGAGDTLLIGGTGQLFSGFAIDFHGNLWATTGESSATPESLYSIDRDTGDSTFVCGLSSGDVGEHLVSIPLDLSLIRVSGSAGVFDPMTGVGTSLELLSAPAPNSSCAATSISVPPELQVADCGGVTMEPGGSVLWKVGTGPGVVYQFDPSFSTIWNTFTIDVVSTGLASVPLCTSQDEFLRGDSNYDGSVNVADVVRLIDVIFNGVATICDATDDANGDETRNIADPIYLLSYFFSMGPPPPLPFPLCGPNQFSTIGCPITALCP